MPQITTALSSELASGWSVNYALLAKISEQSQNSDFTVSLEQVEVVILLLAKNGYIQLDTP